MYNGQWKIAPGCWDWFSFAWSVRYRNEDKYSSSIQSDDGSVWSLGLRLDKPFPWFSHAWTMLIGWNPLPLSSKHRRLPNRGMLVPDAALLDVVLHGGGLVEWKLLVLFMGLRGVELT